MSWFFQKQIKVPFKEFGNNLLYCVSLPGCIWQFGLKYANIRLQTLQDNELILALENIIRGSKSSVMGDRYVKTELKKR